MKVVTLIVCLVVVGVVWLLVWPGLRDALDLSKAEESVRSVVQANQGFLRPIVEAGRCGEFGAGSWPLGEVVERVGRQPTSVPVSDGWGNPLLFWSDGFNCAVYSTGADDRLARRIEDVLTELGPTKVDLKGDVIAVNGQMRQWPLGVRERVE